MSEFRDNPLPGRGEQIAKPLASLSVRPRHAGAGVDGDGVMGHSGAAQIAADSLPLGAGKDVRCGPPSSSQDWPRSCGSLCPVGLPRHALLVCPGLVQSLEGIARMPAGTQRGVLWFGWGRRLGACAGLGRPERTPFTGGAVFLAIRSWATELSYRPCSTSM